MDDNVASYEAYDAADAADDAMTLYTSIPPCVAFYLMQVVNKMWI